MVLLQEVVIDLYLVVLTGSLFTIVLILLYISFPSDETETSVKVVCFENGLFSVYLFHYGMD